MGSLLKAFSKVTGVGDLFGGFGDADAAEAEQAARPPASEDPEIMEARRRADERARRSAGGTILTGIDTSTLLGGG